MSTFRDLLTTVQAAEYCDPAITSRQAFDRRRADPAFPKPITIPGDRRHYWLKADLDSWLTRHIENARSAA